MSFDELVEQFPQLSASWNNVHTQKSDSSADSEYWHTPVYCCSAPIAHCIKELKYADGSSKLVIKYTSWDEDRYAAAVQDSGFMGDIARGLSRYYPDIKYVLDTDWVELAPGTVAYDKFAEIYEHIMTHKEQYTDTKPVVVTVTEDD